MASQLITQYYNSMHNLRRIGERNESALEQPFNMLVSLFANPKHYIYTKSAVKGTFGKNVIPDGVLKNGFGLSVGLVENKDTKDSIDDEIEKKIQKDGYPAINILFQDSITAVLIQNGEEVQRVDMQDATRLESILKAFIEFKPKYLVEFEQALEKFKEDIPTIVETLRKLMDDQVKTNPTYIQARDDFWEMCKQEINPEIKPEDIREMVIQHILTEDLFKSVFDETDFHHENNIARELEKLSDTFMTRDIRQNQLSELGYYYKTLNAQASSVADHHEKQKFLKVVYENFYKVYNPKGADRLGVVYTPNEIVDFMIRSTDYLLEKHFGRNLHDQNVHILDPATGTGTFITDIIEYIPTQYLEHKYKHEIHANEVAILPYYVANLNIEFTYKQRMGKYAEFPNICFVDTLDNTSALTWDRQRIGGEAEQISLFGGVSHENAERIKRQNSRKISVVIGNPPYNANQANFNDFNKNREYPLIDKRIKNTFVKESTAQKTKVYDMYARFYRWSMDRLDSNGVVAFITNRSFIDSRTFDGFRKCIQDEFDYCYVIDTKSDVRANPKIAGTTHNVFGIQTGVAIMFLVKKSSAQNVIPRSEERTTKESASNGEIASPAARNDAHGECRIYYNGDLQDEQRKEEKLQWISEQKFENLRFENITPKKNNWINLTDNDWEELVPLDKFFISNSIGVSTNRDEWVFDYSKKNVDLKSRFLVNEFNKSIQERQIRDSIKWSSTLESQYKKGRKANHDKQQILTFEYRPYCKIQYYANKIFSDRLTQNHYDLFGSDLNEQNKCISIAGKNHSKDFQTLAISRLFGLDYLEKTQCLPLYRYTSDGKREDNITDWGLEQFRERYSTPGSPSSGGGQGEVTKQDIFHYTYGVLHNPAYREKYALNLKREFPRLPFYEDFWQWAAWGKQLMDLHIGYEEVEAYPLEKKDMLVKGHAEPVGHPEFIEGDPPRTLRQAQSDNPRLKVKLKANKEAGIIELDERTSLHGIPPEAWEYKLGNRSALEWILDQYKEKKPKDKTIAEKFNTYRFADYKEQVIDLLKRVCTVSVETVKVVREMEKIKS